MTNPNAASTDPSASFKWVRHQVFTLTPIVGSVTAERIVVVSFKVLLWWICRNMTV